jgi:hypothetical protein
MCGCYGYPINPIFCDSCELKILGLALFDQIDKALDIKLHSWQKEYILTGKLEAPPGRGVGKTTAYCIKWALCSGKYLFRELKQIRDESHGSMYESWFVNEFMKIRHRLESIGLAVCEVIK